MIQLCLTLAAALAVNTPIDHDDRTTELRKRIEARECMIVPAGEFQRSVRGLEIVQEIHDVFVLTGTNDGVRFWSWTYTTSDFGRRLKSKESV